MVKGDRHVTRFDGSEERRLAGGNFESQVISKQKKNKFAHNGEVKKKKLTETEKSFTKTQKKFVSSTIS